MPLISVVIPTNNSETTLNRCLDSVIHQDFTDFEIVIIDGASTDDTIEIIESYDYSDNRVRYITEPDNGVYDAMNKGVSHANGNWLYFLGSDDELHDDQVFSSVFSQPISEKVGALYGNVQVMNNTIWAHAGAIYDGKFNLRKLLKKNICHQAIFYRKTLFSQWGVYNIKYPICADWELNLRFFSKTKFRYINKTIANFYGGLTRQKITDPFFEEMPTLVEKYYGTSLDYLFLRCINAVKYKVRLFFSAN